MKDLRAATALIEDHITYMEERGKAAQYIKSAPTAVMAAGRAAIDMGSTSMP
jgi:hypothetical protein